MSHGDDGDNGDDAAMTALGVERRGLTSPPTDRLRSVAYAPATAPRQSRSSSSSRGMSWLP